MLEEKLDMLMKMMQAMGTDIQKRFDGMEERLTSIDERLQRVEEKTDASYLMVQEVGKGVAQLQVDVNELREEVEYLHTKAVEHDKKLFKIEKRIH
ncbi:hypothetical protein BT246_48380 [Bacillus thuringiensis]|uniref:Uncharacterized protein n=1 Tax=Bacillus thuringiensis TaxID=1428 RepID=A0A9W3X2H6_BACTU|nr:hypothetical protein [Bacillus thuringiensis]ANS50174.1 hypothetical protein BT246_48380 [Bacillus thuringiensis]